MKSNIRERNDSAEQWKGGISFHSIYYRYFSFIFALLILFFYVVGKRQGLETLDVDLSLVQLQLSPREFALYGNGILLLFSIPFYFYKKLKIGREGIYLPGIKLFVPWEEITAVSHVWINEWSIRPNGRQYLYNRKSLVIYRKDNKPICIYNISLLALYTIKILKPSIKTNIIVATLATIFNIVLNFGILYSVYSREIEFIKIELFLSYIVVYIIKMTLVPLAMVKYENIKHGKYLFHDNAYNKNSSKVIQL